MIQEKLLSLDYYLDKLSLYMKQSYGVQEQLDLLHKILVRIDSSLDDLFVSLNVMNENYIVESGNTSDILDKVAAIYGVTRQFSVKHLQNNVMTTFELTLNNYELLMLIRARIIQNTFKGSYEECMEFYKLIGMEGNIVISNDVNNAVCNLYLRQISSTIITENIKHMFLSGLLTLQSAGIQYNHSEYDITTYGVWNNSKWDSPDRKWY